jgi:predicted nucleotidyltransferase
MYKTDARRPVNPVTLVILRTLQEIAEAYGARHFIIGATARDIVMTHVFGIDVQRATRDVDFAIALENWGDNSKPSSKHSLRMGTSPQRRTRLIVCTTARISMEMPIHWT